jgi:hypothetical protein
MCGRYRLSRRKQFIAEHFDSIPGDDDWSPRGAGDRVQRYAAGLI